MNLMSSTGDHIFRPELLRPLLYSSIINTLGNISVFKVNLLINLLLTSNSRPAESKKIFLQQYNYASLASDTMHISPKTKMQPSRKNHKQTLFQQHQQLTSGL